MQPPPRALRLPVLLDQQFWFLGHDIRHSGGNALLRFGFVRWRPPSAGGTSCYVLALSDQAPLEAVVCWGFAAYCGPVSFSSAQLEPPDSDAAEGGVLVLRHARTPRLIHRPLPLPINRLADLPAAHTAHAVAEEQRLRAHLARLAEVFSRYEQWARGALGDAYRLSTLSALPRHKQRRFEPQPDLSEQWTRWQQ